MLSTDRDMRHIGSQISANSYTFDFVYVYILYGAESWTLQQLWEYLREKFLVRSSNQYALSMISVFEWINSCTIFSMTWMGFTAWTISTLENQMVENISSLGVCNCRRRASKRGILNKVLPVKKVIELISITWIFST